jgi:hypothetical protein
MPETTRGFTGRSILQKNTVGGRMSWLSTPVSISAYRIRMKPNGRTPSNERRAALGQQTGQHVAAVERRDRQQVEEGQQQVDEDGARQDVTASRPHLGAPRRP